MKCLTQELTGEDLRFLASLIVKEATADPLHERDDEKNGRLNADPSLLDVVF